MWVKVCGVTSRQVAEAAIAAGADAIGLVLVDSPRRVTPVRAREIGRGLDAERVALVDVTTPDEALGLLDLVGATGVQPYGAAAADIADTASAEGYLVLRPMPVVDGLDLSVVPTPQLPLLDASDPELRGGTGRRFDWVLAQDPGRPVVVAGGLDADNVREAIERLDPWGVDASSRLESSPGRKDVGLVRAFVLAAKQKAPAT